MLNSLFWIVPVCSLIALLFAWMFFRGMMKESEGTDTMKRIASHVRKGAMAYLRQQYKIVGFVFLILCIFLPGWPMALVYKMNGYGLLF